jgi:ADP-ribosylation factor-like protein 1
VKQEEELKEAILLVFANKQDQKGALNAKDVRLRSLSIVEHLLFPPCLSQSSFDSAVCASLWARQLSEALALPEVRNRQWSIQETCAIKGNGLFQGFDWLVTCIKGD